MDTFGKEIGNVLWYDQNKGYGFIKIITPGSDLVGKDIFVHFSSINAISSFKKIYPGEFVSLDVVETDEKKNYGCSNVTGVYGNSLLIDNKDHIIKVYNRKNDDK